MLSFRCVAAGVLVALFVLAEAAALAATPAPSQAARLGPCPGLPLDSCECFQRLHKQSVWTANLTNGIERNWWIILSYQDLGQSLELMLAKVMNPALDRPPVAVWPNMAVWASLDVGYGIREQGFQQMFAWWFRHSPQWMQEAVQGIPNFLNDVLRPLVNRTSQGLAGGNQLVFQEIGLSYSRYGMEFCNVSVRDEARMARFLDKHVCPGGACELAQGLQAMFDAHFPKDPATATYSDRDQLLLVQGLLTGLQEQTKLIPYLNMSLPGYDFCIKNKTTGRNEWCLLPRQLNELATSLLVHLTVGNHRMPVTNDVPSGIWGDGNNFSPYLKNLTNPWARKVMTQMQKNLTNIDCLNGTAARNWDVLWERMRVISQIFRVFQDHPEINCYAFTAKDENTLRAGGWKSLDDDTFWRQCQTDCCEMNGRWSLPRS